MKPIWSSEIEPFPCAVTKVRFPETKQLGDVTKINGAEIEPVDIICAGSPCQDLSIAGKRKGLNGERSGLFHTAIDIVRRMRVRTGGQYPRYFVWENVPGAFSSNRGMDFQAVLEEIGETEIPMPEKNRWAESGLVQCPNTEIAWRVLDAQYWGVPQRRKRIFLVADFGGRSAGEILFEPESLSGDTKKSGEKGKGIAEGAESGFRRTGRHIEVMPFDTTTLATSNDQTLIRCYDMTHADEVIRPIEGNKSCTLNARMGTGGNQVPIIHKITASNHQELEGTLVTRSNQQGPEGTVVTDSNQNVAYSISGNIIGREDKNGGHHMGIDKEISFTLNTVDRHAVCIGNGQVEQLKMSDKVGALNCMHDQQCVMTFVDKASTLRAGAGVPKHSGDYHIIKNKTVRRLTPLECERLQGLPDGFTLIDDKTCSDSARYKALGNGMAAPCADYVIRRIVEVVGSE